MIFLSFSEFKNEPSSYSLSKKLSDLGIPKNQFVKTALRIANSVQHLVPESCKVSAAGCIEVTEKYLRGEATPEECGIAYNTAYYSSGAYAAASASSAYAASVASASAASYAGYASASASASAASDLFREYFPWEWVCGYQVARALNREGDEKFILEVSQNQKLMAYATMILSEESMHKNLEFFMLDYITKRS